MSKVLLNLLLQISKALVNSEIQFLIQKFLFPYFWPGLLPYFFSSPAATHLLPPCPAQSAHRLLRLSDLAACRFRPSPAPLVRFGRRLPLANRWAHPVSEPGVITFIGQRLSSRAPPPLPGHRAPPSSTPRVPPDRYHMTFIFPPLNPLLNPSSSSMALKPLTPALNSPATPPRRSPGPYKR
jgi:hypothetical protein